MFGDRLNLSRRSAGLSLRDLAARMDHIVTAQALGKYERNEMMPNSTVLIALTKALDVSEAYLLSSGEIELSGVEFRKLQGTSAKEQAKVEAEVLRHAERYLEIEDILAADTAEFRLPTMFPRPISTIEQAEQAAEALRRTWNLGEDPIPRFAEYLEEQGIKVLALDLPDAVSGLTATVQKQNGRQVPVIVINNNHAGERQRFTLAHELGHLVLEMIGIDSEAVCNRFAGAFLAPGAMVLSEVGKKRNGISLGELIRLKPLFLVSIQCLIYRLKDLQVITQRLYEELFDLITDHGWKKEEPEPLPPEKTQRFERLCFRALAENLISESKAAELLNVTVRQLNQMVEFAA